MRAELLSVGTELLLGQIVDTNAAWLAERLALRGIDVLWISTVGDNLGRATEAFSRALERSDLIVATGGLGPTEDDLTREAISAALGETPTVDPDLETDLRAWFASRGLAMPERNRKQAWLIPSAIALPNPLGTAPGWLVSARGRSIVAMPGVPREMTRMWEREAEPRLPLGAPLRSRTLKLIGIGESAVEEALGELVRSTAPTVATYAKADGVHIRITDRDPDGAARDARIERMEREIRARVGEHVWGADSDDLVQVVAAALRARGWRAAVAEGATGGEMARALADAGDAFAGGSVLPGRAEPELFSSLDAFGAEALLVSAPTDGGASLCVRTPSRSLRREVRAGSAAETRRRAALVALDLLRRAALP